MNPRYSTQAAGRPIVTLPITSPTGRFHVLWLVAIAGKIGLIQGGRPPFGARLEGGTAP